jgi:hypothetical protein
MTLLPKPNWYSGVSIVFVTARCYVDDGDGRGRVVDEAEIPQVDHPDLVRAGLKNIRPGFRRRER